MSGPNYDGRYGPINESNMCAYCTQPAVYGILDNPNPLDGPAIADGVLWLCTTHNQARVADWRLAGESKDGPM